MSALAVALALATSSSPAAAQNPAGEPMPAPPPVIVPPAPQRPVAVTLTIWPERALKDARVKFTSLRHPPMPAFERQIEAPSSTQLLPPGRWRIEVTARRHVGLTEVDVQPGRGPISVRLEKKGAQQDKGRRFGHAKGDEAVLVMGSLVQVLAGAGLVAAGGVIQSKAQRRNETTLTKALVEDGGLAQVELEYPVARLHHDLRRASNLTTGGLTAAASGLGTLLVFVAVTTEARRRVAWIEMGLGAAMVAGGGAWMANYLHRSDLLLGRDDPTQRTTMTEWRPVTGHQVGSALLTGVGAGMVLFSTVALAMDSAAFRRQRRYATIVPYTTPMQAGLLLRGRF